MKFKKLNTNAIIPTKAHNAAGFDLYSISSGLLEPGTVMKISTGIAWDCPDYLFGLIKDRSSMAAKGLFVIGGVIDPDYRGEISVVLSSNVYYSFACYDRIAQLVILPRYANDAVEVQELSATVRGDSGFGSSGK